MRRSNAYKSLRSSLRSEQFANNVFIEIVLSNNYLLIYHNWCSGASDFSTLRTLLHDSNLITLFKAFAYPDRIERGGIGCPYEHWMVNELRKRDGILELIPGYLSVAKGGRFYESDIYIMMT